MATKINIFLKEIKKLFKFKEKFIVSILEESRLKRNVKLNITFDKHFLKHKKLKNLKKISPVTMSGRVGHNGGQLQFYAADCPVTGTYFRAWRFKLNFNVVFGIYDKCLTGMNVLCSFYLYLSIYN